MLRKLLLSALGLLFLSCQTPEKGEGPFFANGIKNGWADQNSIVLWTRLTQNKEAL
jgi:phosphodiesterase/alkaline phosphatase D-like protein